MFSSPPYASTITMQGILDVEVAMVFHISCLLMDHMFYMSFLLSKRLHATNKTYLYIKTFLL